MSASKDKLYRKQQAESGLDKRTAAARKEEEESRKTRIRYTIIGVAIVLIFAFIFFYNSALPSRLFTAVTINGQSYSVAQLNYYYSQAFADYYNDHIVEIFTGQSSLDTSTSFADQLYTPADGEDAADYPADYTWRDYFIDRAVERMEEVQLLTAQAESAGFALPEEDEEDYDEAIQSIQDNWSDQNYSSLQQYINLNYGKGVTLSLIEQELHRSVVADAYAESLRDAYTYTDAELDAAYAEKADDYDVIDYAYYYVADDTVDAEALALAVDGTGEDEFTAYMEENYDGLTPTVTSGQGENLSDIYADWLLDPARKAGDAAVLTDEHEHDEDEAEEEDVSSYVVMFLGRSDNDYKRVSFRHILINTDNEDVYDSAYDSYYGDEDIAAGEELPAEMPEETAAPAAEESEAVQELGEGFGETVDDGGLIEEFTDDTAEYGEGSDEDVIDDIAEIEDEPAEEEETFEDALLAAALARAEEIYAEWKAGDATEDSFAALAEEYTDDSGSAENGGLYEEVTKGQMVPPIDEWIFDAARKSGDTTVVTYSGDNYSGAHIVYFVGAEDETYAHVLAREDLAQADYDAWLAEQTAGDVVTTSHLRMVGKHR